MNKTNLMVGTSMVIILSVPFMMGMAMVGVKQFSRTINEETLAKIQTCQTTEKEIVKLFRKPTEDYTAKQGDYTVYTYYGFVGRGGTDKQKLEVLLNDQNVVTNFRLNYEGDEPMQDTCIG